MSNPYYTVSDEAEELRAQVKRLRAAIGIAHDLLDADEDKWTTALLVLKEALEP